MGRVDEKRNEEAEHGREGIRQYCFIYKRAATRDDHLIRAVGVLPARNESPQKDMPYPCGDGTVYLPEKAVRREA